MDSATLPAVLAATVIVGTLLASGPAIGLLDRPAVGTAELGDGDATVTAITLVERPRFAEGRFGTGVRYLRVPRLAVTVGSVTGHPRLVYTFAIPELGFERVATEPLGDAGSSTVVVRMSDRAFAPRQLDSEAYAGTVTVRIQSFTTDRVIERRNVTVRVVE